VVAKREIGRGLVGRGVRRFLARKTAVLGLGLLVAIVLLAVFAPLVAPYGPFERVGGRHQAPDREHVLGTDTVGRDVLTRLIYGARTSLTVSFAAVLLRSVLGITLGLVAGYYGGWVDRIITRLVDVFMAFPFVLLAILVVSTLGPSLRNVIIALGITGWTGLCRITRAQALSVRQMEFVLAARVVGVSDARMMLRHILPNCLGPVAIVTSLSVAGAILSESGLSFLGLGIAPPNASWGVMLATGRQALFTHPQLILAPAAAILATTLAFNLIGDGLRDALDPRESRA
jgi:ABC-type dipeptide/oligopeptide/nickel transport system permease subunit